MERSSDQVIKPINLEALTKWVDQFPEDILKNAARLAPMLVKLGYDPYSLPPNYGSPDAFVQNNTNSIHTNPEIWQKRAKSLFLTKNEVNILNMSTIDEKSNQFFNNVSLAKSATV